MLAAFIVLILLTSGLTRPLTKENEKLAREMAQLYEEIVDSKINIFMEQMKLYSLLAATAENHDLQKEVEQQTQQLKNLGQLLHEEADRSHFARKRGMVGLKHLVEGSASSVDVDEEALQDYIEQFHKTLRGSHDEYTRHRRSGRIEPPIFETTDDLNSGEGDDLAES
ncbi:unnamed protein product [Taenia asiatica]|uniref:DUF148 domain-containing protein n=1 Tax=Taenia asiatica TaxID=60517 RepID=A0A0R3W1W1_TAEAS|nr:unnamed protein product [Taenia asiatica]